MHSRSSDTRTTLSAGASADQGKEQGAGSKERKGNSFWTTEGWLVQALTRTRVLRPSGAVVAGVEASQP